MNQALPNCCRVTTVVSEDVPFQPYPHPCLCLWVLISLPSAGEQDYYITRWSIWLLAPTGWQSGLSMFFICVWWPCLNSERTVRDASEPAFIDEPSKLALPDYQTLADSISQSAASAQSEQLSAITDWLPGITNAQQKKQMRWQFMHLEVLLKWLTTSTQPEARCTFAIDLELNRL